jgi:hypothetical protein
MDTHRTGAAPEGTPETTWTGVRAECTKGPQPGPWYEGAGGRSPAHPPRRLRRQSPQGASLRQLSTVSFTAWVPVVP